MQQSKAEENRVKGQRVLVICGPTAVGKTKYAIEAARNFNGEIVSCDSMQLYKFMDIGSAKPTDDELSMAKHHLVDFIDPRDDFSVAAYQKLARSAIDDILKRGRLPVISGGTGLYLNAILYDMDFANAPKDEEYRQYLKDILDEQGPEPLHKMLEKLDPDAASQIHANNTKKIIRALERLHMGEDGVQPFSAITEEWEAYDPVIVGLTRDRNELYDRINRRVLNLIDQGLVDEVRGLMEMGLTADNISMKGIGYKEIIDYIEGRVTLDEAIVTVQKNTRHYAKRQLTWFRRYDRIMWYDISAFDSEETALREFDGWLQKRL